MGIEYVWVQFCHPVWKYMDKTQLVPAVVNDKLVDKRLFNGVPDLRQVKIHNTAVSFLYAIHKNSLLRLSLDKIKCRNLSGRCT